MVYEIIIEGYVNETRFDGFEITKLPNSTTQLHGELADQAALMGVLRMINDLGIHLISVHRLEKVIAYE